MKYLGLILWVFLLEWCTFSEDGVEYRAVIESITGTSCVVKYVDYGNSESKPLSELKPAPSKPKVGDAVRAVYSEDSVEYEAVVKRCRIISVFFDFKHLTQTDFLVQLKQILETNSDDFSLLTQNFGNYKQKPS